MSTKKDTTPKAEAAEGVTTEAAETVSKELFEKAVEAAETAEARVVELEGDLRAANQTNAALQAELDQANETIESMAQDVAEAAVETDAVFFTDEDGDKYELVQPVFRYKGKEYKSAEAVEEHPEVLQELVEAKAFILKKV